MQINMNKTASANLIDLINLDNGTELTEAEISLGAPSEFVDPEGINDRNTQVTVSAVEGGGYTDSVDVRYYRLDIDSLRGARVLSRELTDTSTVATVVTAMAGIVNLLENQVELQDNNGVTLTELPAVAEGTSTTVRLAAVAGSYTYIGSAEVTLSRATTETPVGDDVQQQDLSGFDEPEQGGTTE